MTDTDAPSIQQVASDLDAEGDELYTLLCDTDTSIWTQPSAFKHWSVWDVVAHLHLFDHMALTSIYSADSFHSLLAQLREAKSMHNYIDRWLCVDGHAMTGPQLLERWHDNLLDLCIALDRADPDQQFSWMESEMKARMLATQRQMETWAHGWEVYDLMGKQRTSTARLKNIAAIGVETFSWTFSNRKLPVPDTPPYVNLRGPGGEKWQWNGTDNPHHIEGDAVEFCQVVTQVRNVADTALKVQGDNATAWMQIAQCFAGPVEDPPAPGMRT